MTRSAETPFERRERLNIQAAIALSCSSLDSSSDQISTLSNNLHLPPTAKRQAPIGSSPIFNHSTIDNHLSNSRSSHSIPAQSPSILVPPTIDHSSPILPPSDPHLPRLLAPASANSPQTSSIPRAPRLSDAPILEPAPPQTPLRLQSPSTPLTDAPPPKSPLLSHSSGQLPPTLLVGHPHTPIIVPPPPGPSGPSAHLSIPDAPPAPPKSPRPAGRPRKKQPREPAGAGCSETSGTRSGTRIRKRSALGKASDATLSALLELEQPAERPRLRIASSDADEAAMVHTEGQGPAGPARAPKQAISIVMLSSSPLSSPGAESADGLRLKAKQPRVSERAEEETGRKSKKKKAPVGRKNKKAVGTRPDERPTDERDARPEDEDPKRGHPAKARGRPRRSAEEHSGAPGPAGPEPIASPARGSEKQEASIAQGASEPARLAPDTRSPTSSRASSKPATCAPSSHAKASCDSGPLCTLAPLSKPLAKRPSLGRPKTSRPKPDGRSLAEILALTNPQAAKVGFRVGLKREEKHRLHAKIEPRPVVVRQIKGKRKRRRGEYDSGEDSVKSDGGSTDGDGGGGKDKGKKKAVDDEEEENEQVDDDEADERPVDDEAY